MSSFRERLPEFNVYHFLLFLVFVIYLIKIFRK